MKSTPMIQQIKQHLLDGYSITPMEALSKFNCYRLAARIHELREEGLNIETAILPDGGYAKYFIKPANDNFKETA